MSSDWYETAVIVYSPDAIQSGLVSVVDRFIQSATQLKRGEAFLAIHDERSIDRFYGLDQTDNVGPGVLVRDLFTARPVIVTLWRGADALSRLQEVKGNTQPALAHSGSVRSLFWCDNPICNLIHVSDDIEDMEDDYKVLLDRKVADLGRYNDNSNGNKPPLATLRHNALLEFRRVLLRNRRRAAAVRDHLALPPNGDATETALLLIRDLIATAVAGPRPVARLIRCFLLGEEDFRAISAAHLGRRSGWEDLVIRCGIESNKRWIERLYQNSADKRKIEQFVEIANA